MATKHATINENGFVLFTSKLGLLHVQNSVPRYGTLLQALLDDNFTEEAFIKLLSEVVTCDLEELSGGEVTKTSDDTYTFKDGEDTLELPADIYTKMQELISKGASYDHLRNFWKRCQCNPRKESVQQLFAFVSRHLLTITDEGLFVAYKAVRNNYYDKHSGTFDNHPGLVVTMPRGEVTFDPNMHCAAGLHVSNYDYAHGFADGDDRIVVCLVDPADVVSVPHDCDAQKIRVCKYIVQSDYTESLAFKETSVVDGSLNQVSDITQINVNRPWSSDEDDAIVEFLFELDGEEPMFTAVASLANTLARTTDGVYARMQSIIDTDDPVNSYDSYEDYIEGRYGCDDDDYDDDDYDDEDEDCDAEPVCGSCCGHCTCHAAADDAAVPLNLSLVEVLYANTEADGQWYDFAVIAAIAEELSVEPSDVYQRLQAMNDKVPFSAYSNAGSYMKALGDANAPKKEADPVKDPWEEITSTVMNEDQLQYLYEQVKIFGYNWKVIQRKLSEQFPNRPPVHEDTLRKTAKRMGL